MCVKILVPYHKNVLKSNEMNHFSVVFIFIRALRKKGYRNSAPGILLNTRVLGGGG